MKLPRLSPDEIRDLQVDGRDPDWNLAERIKAHLMAGLPAHVRVEVGVPASAGSKIETESPHLRADDNLLAAWVAARFGSGVLCKPVPAHYGTDLLARVGQALAEFTLRGKTEEPSSLHLEIRLNDQRGTLELDWSHMSPGALRAWALKQWKNENG